MHSTSIVPYQFLIISEFTMPERWSNVARDNVVVTINCRLSVGNNDLDKET
jgi:hypothetical protein